jgi:hypothetical protein
MKKSVLFFFGVAAVLIGMGFVMPAVALMRDTGALPTVSVGLLLLGLAMTLSGAAAVFVGAKGLRRC